MKGIILTTLFLLPLDCGAAYAQVQVDKSVSDSNSTNQTSEFLTVDHPSIEVLQFLTGFWKSKTSKMEEIWSPSNNGSMLGIRKTVGAHGSLEIQLIVMREGKYGTGGTMQDFDYRMRNKNRQQVPTQVCLKDYGRTKAVFSYRLGKSNIEEVYNRTAENVLQITRNVDGKILEEEFEREVIKGDSLVQRISPES